MFFRLHHHRHRRRRRLWLTFDFEADEYGDDESDKFIVLALSRLETPCNKSALLLSTQPLLLLYFFGGGALGEGRTLFAICFVCVFWNRKRTLLLPLQIVWRPRPSIWGVPRFSVCVWACIPLFLFGAEKMCVVLRDALNLGWNLKLCCLFNMRFNSGLQMKWIRLVYI